MFVWGAKGVVANLGPQASKHCPTCERERPFHLLLQYTVRHIWYVFKWVTGKQYASVCDVCQRGTKLDGTAVESSLAKPPIPFGQRWGWAFLAAAVAVFAAWGVFEDWNRGSHREAYLAAPKAGDRYIVNAASLLKAPQSKYLYTVFRVRTVKPDAVEFDAATVFYSGVSGPEKDMRDGKLDQPDYFGAKPIVLSRDDIARIQKDHAIFSIDRF